MLDFWSMNIFGTTSIKQKSNAAGLQKFSLICVTDIDSIAVNTDSWSVLVSGIKTVQSYYIYDFKFKAGAYTEEKEKTEHGDVYHSTIELLIARDDAYRCISAKSLTNQRFVAVIEDLNGICKIIGLKKQPVKLVTSKLENSTKNTYRFIFESIQTKPSLFFDKGTNIYATTPQIAPTIPTEFLKVGDLAISILATKTSLVIPVISNLSFTTSENASWFSVSAVSPSSVSLSIQVNTATTSRTGSLTITAGSISRTIIITQQASTIPAASIIVTPTLINAQKSGSTTVLLVNANVSYTVISNNTFISVFPNGTLGPGYYVATVDANTTATTRTGTITVSCSGISKTISISQEGTPVIITLSTSDSLFIVKDGGVVTTNISVNPTSTISVISDSNWLVASLSGTTLNLTANQNIGAQRVGIATITAGTTTKTISVTQYSALLVSATNKAKKVAKLTSYTQKPNFVPFQCVMPYLVDNSIATGFWRPKWMVFAQLGHNIFDSNNQPFSVGFAGSPDFRTWMTRGKDWIYPTNPDTANDLWANNTDPATTIFFPPNGKNVNEFIGFDPKGRVTNFLNDVYDYGDLTAYYDAGKSQTVFDSFGKGDYIGGKAQGLFVAMDHEWATDETGWQKKTALAIGCIANFIGFGTEFYTPVFVTYSGMLDSNHAVFLGDYPNATNNYETSARICPVWDYRNPTRVTITNRGISNKSLLDYPNSIPSQEVAFYNIDFQPHLSTYDLGNNKFVTIRAYGAVWDASPNGTGFNIQGAFFKLATHAECFGWYCFNKLSEKIGVFQIKPIADQGGSAGLADWIVANDGSIVSDTILNRQNLLQNRDHLFVSAMVEYMNRTHGWVWAIAGDNDGSHYNVNASFDGHYGLMAAVEMVTNRGAVLYFEDMIPEFWQTKYSLDGVNYKSTKAAELNQSATDRLYVRTKIGRGPYHQDKLEIFAYRPYGIEPTEFWVKVVVNQIERIIHVTSEMWDTLNPDFGNIANSQIPTAHKRYFYNFFQF